MALDQAPHSNHPLVLLSTELHGIELPTTVVCWCTLTPVRPLPPSISCLYVSDCANHCIRKVDLATRRVTVFAGRPGEGGFANSKDATQALFCKV